MFTINVTRPRLGQWEVTVNVFGDVLKSSGPTLRIALLGAEAAYSVKKAEIAESLRGAGL